MPVLLSTKARFEVSLDGDTELNPMPVFIVKALSAEVFSETIALIESVKGSVGKTETINAVLERAESIVVGWRNLKDGESEISYEPGKLSKLLTFSECLELLGKAVMGATLNEGERKK